MKQTIKAILKCIIVVIILISIWNMLPFSFSAKVFIFAFLSLPCACWIYVGISWLLDILPDNDEIAKLFCYVLAIAFVLILVVLHFATHSHYKSYIQTEPYYDSVYFKVDYDVEIAKNTGVGGDWYYNHKINGKRIEKGEIIAVEGKQPFLLATTITESDDISDFGEIDRREYVFGGKHDFSEEFKILRQITVKERGGRTNKGAYADFDITYTFKRVAPESMTFWDFLLFTNNKSLKCLYFYLAICLLLIPVLLVLVYFDLPYKSRVKQSVVRSFIYLIFVFTLPIFILVILITIILSIFSIVFEK